MPAHPVGISGFAAYLPPSRVRLADWCRWTGDNWDKVRQVVGQSFRMRAANENAYTMAATAVLRLIRQYDVDPQRVGMLALGTESATDNSAGAVIVKGMVNQGLLRLGLPPLARACEVPEFKHACLGGVYALKAANRFLATDGQGQLAIVVCSDIAEYARASSGEPTQGAGAVAMLVEQNPRLLAMEMHLAGSSSDYRGADFRKPFLRFLEQSPSALGQPRDFPVFNGRYSTTCYIEAMLSAVRDMFRRLNQRPSRFLRELAASFLHRPYQRMAETGLVMSYLLALAVGDGEDLAEFEHYARQADVDGGALRQELTTEPAAGSVTDAEQFPLATATARSFREAPRFGELMTRLGVGPMQEVGNLYTASLPAWIAAGLEQAAAEPAELTGQRILTLGYGSGDAAEAIPMRLTEGWRAAAGRIDFAGALAGPVDLAEEEYAALHEGLTVPAQLERPGVFYIDRIGHRDRAADGFDDHGIEYYRIEV